MATGLDSRCLYSTVKNTSGGRKTFGFLPPHGRTLAANETLTIWGDIRESVISFERTSARRNIIALENALYRGDIDIIHTPAQIIADPANPGSGTSRMLTVTNGALGMSPPCWNTPTSLSVDVPG